MLGTDEDNELFERSKRIARHFSPEIQSLRHGSHLEATGDGVVAVVKILMARRDAPCLDLADAGDNREMKGVVKRFTDWLVELERYIDGC